VILSPYPFSVLSVSSVFSVLRQSKEEFENVRPTMVKTKICKGDKVIVIQGEGALYQDEAGKPQLCTVLKVDRVKGRAIIDMPRPKPKKKEREKPVRGVEQWKTARYNPKTGEAGGLKIVKKSIHVSNLQIVEKAPQREFAK
jgi:ribosomal protein L24